MRRVALAIWAVNILVVAVSAQQPDTAIVPGERIGPISLRMHIADAAKILGTPKPATLLSDPSTVIVPRPEGAVAYYWESSKFFVQTNRLGEIYIVQVYLVNASDPSTKYATSTGLRLGSRDTDVQTTFGAPSRIVSRVEKSGFRSDVLVYDKQGILFFVNASQGQYKGAVYAISVFAPPNQ